MYKIKPTPLTNESTISQRGIPLVRTQNKRFRLTISINLDKNYCFQKLNKEDLKQLDNFISETVGKDLSISEVDTLFLRNKGPVKTSETIKGKKRDVVHYGKDKKAFRIHGFYNDDGYFVIYQIDAKHKKHKQK